MIISPVFEEKKTDEATPCLGDELDSRVVGGLGKRTLLLAPGPVIMYGMGPPREPSRSQSVMVGHVG